MATRRLWARRTGRGETAGRGLCANFLWVTGLQVLSEPVVVLGSESFLFLPAGQGLSLISDGGEEINLQEIQTVIKQEQEEHRYRK